MLIFFYLLFSVLVGIWADKKPALGFLGGFVLSLLLSPLIGLIITAASKDKPAPAVLPTNNPSPTDEVYKASQLLNAGHITPEEFAAIKEKHMPGEATHKRLMEEMAIVNAIKAKRAATDRMIWLGFGIFVLLMALICLFEQIG